MIHDLPYALSDRFSDLQCTFFQNVGCCARMAEGVVSCQMEPWDVCVQKVSKDSSAKRKVEKVKDLLNVDEKLGQDISGRDSGAKCRKCQGNHIVVLEGHFK